MADLAEQRLDVLRLDGEHDDVGALDRLGVRGRRLDPVALAQLARASSRRAEAMRFAQSATQPGEQRFADLAGAEDREPICQAYESGGARRMDGRLADARAVGQRDQAAREPRQQVHAREPGPLLVRREQRLRLLRLDPAAPERELELDEPEVAASPSS